ncbi:ubiquinone/menaquinone biosynthesis methyltransferase, partial [Alphaproteobacteria bacterium]|nr:ubiquinone/menaquinone biosynthesis methyltransferase [Alphaproteobacteria bacterium]
WKNNLINWMAPQKNQKLADIAGGTGDIARKFLNNGGHSAYVIDINEEMIKSGKVNKESLKNIKWLVASAEDIPVDDNTFERATMGFGLRNITNRTKALKEVHRILKPGGRFICLEFSHVENVLIEEIYNLWSFKCMPYIGEKVGGDRSAYTYLVESIRQFPTQPEVSEMFSEAGFSRVKYRNLSNGIVSLHSGWKL